MLNYEQYCWYLSAHKTTILYRVLGWPLNSF